MITTINNKHKKLNVPNLRFPEFQGEWEEERLADIADLYKGTGISKDQLSDDGEPCILYGELYTKYKSETIREVISKTNIDNTKLVRSKDNDVIIPCSGETAEDIATARCVLNGNILLGGDLNIIRLHGYDGTFMSYQLNGKRKYDIAKVAQGVSVVHLYGEHLKGVKTINPCLTEQKKIVSLLTLLDERIATQNKIIEDLKKLKSAISKKLLCNDKWTTCIIQDIAEIGRGRVISSVEIDRQKHPLYPVYSSQTSNNGIMGYLDNYMFDGEYITWTTDGANAGTVFYRKGKFNCTNVCGILKILPKFDCYFVSLVLQQATQKYVSSNLANPKLMNNTMASIKIRMPNIETQKQLSKVFQTLDSCLLVHQRTCKMYLSEKQHLLCQMFI
ncbi:restriction endonuclease subunit S [Prevotella intermedia]|nr:restriction endonuclease subunit S [Prevotella intermedia]AWX08074.1 restriction endonuclease subunit S [Prevotella intermedia]